MHYYNATCFGHIRPSSGNTFIRSLIHCAQIKFRWCVIFFLMCASSVPLRSLIKCESVLLIVALQTEEIDYK
jgi:hypothetical protein